MAPTLVEIRGLHVRFPLEEGAVHAVQDVSFTIPRGRTVGLVGESGSGKTMTGLSLLQLIPPPGRIEQGQILYHSSREEPNSQQSTPPGAGAGAGTGARSSQHPNTPTPQHPTSNAQHPHTQTPTHPHTHTDLAALPADGEAIRAIRGRDIAMVFQEPMTSLTPVYTIGQQIGEMVRLHRRLGRREAHAVAVEMLRRVGIPGPEQRVDEYPHQLSGGMRQRAMIAMALSCSPALLIADEPTTALDVTVQAQILDLLRELQQELGMAILLISHDLGVIADLADEVAVMYAGKIVEQGPAETIFYDPRHPYTQGLLRSAPVLGRERGQRLYAIPGTVPSLRTLPKSCAFRPRCERRFDRCLEPPDLVEIAPDHRVRCWAEGSLEGN